MEPRQTSSAGDPTRLGVFARWPRPGVVKTRLSPALPPELACALHVALVADTLATAAAAGARESFVLWADAPRGTVPGTRLEAPAGIVLPAGMRAGAQSGGTLGDRLDTAFDALLAARARAVVIGTDCPGLRPRHLRDAFEALASNDAVLGPARDGGYWLIGLRVRAPALFEGVAWGTDAVLAQTLERAGRARLSVATLETLDDLDTPSDLARLVARGLAEPEAVPPATREALAAMGLLPGAADAPRARPDAP